MKQPKVPLAVPILGLVVSIVAVSFLVSVIYLHVKLDARLFPPTLTKRYRKSRRCKPVYFWGGGKAGSTTLAALLKHGSDGANFDPAGQFARTGKEICWAEKGAHSKWISLLDRCNEGGGKDFILDACPRYYTEAHVRLIVDDDPGAMFIMLVRDPVDRLVSHLNDQRKKEPVKIEEAVRGLITVFGQNKNRRRGGRRRNSRPGNNRGIAIRYRRRLRETLGHIYDNPRGRKGAHGHRMDHVRLGIKGGLDRMNVDGAHVRGRHSDSESRRQGARADVSYWELSLYGRNLRRLLRIVAPSKILIVQTSALGNDPQEVVSKIMAHIGGKPKAVKGLHKNRLGDRDGYQKISHGMRLRLRAAFRSDVELLEHLTGKRFKWSNESVSNGAETEWLTTYPALNNSLGLLPSYKQS